MANQSGQVDPERLVRLEEALGFAEHTIGQLSSEIAEINRRLADTQARLLKLERRLDKVAEGGGADGQDEGGADPGG